jgi:hypothetical protein
METPSGSDAARRRLAEAVAASSEEVTPELLLRLHEELFARPATAKSAKAGSTDVSTVHARLQKALSQRSHCKLMISNTAAQIGRLHEELGALVLRHREWSARLDDSEAVIVSLKEEHDAALSNADASAPLPSPREPSKLAEDRFRSSAHYRAAFVAFEASERSQADEPVAQPQPSARRRSSSAAQLRGKRSRACSGLATGSDDDLESVLARPASADFPEDWVPGGALPMEEVDPPVSPPECDGDRDDEAQATFADPGQSGRELLEASLMPNGRELLEASLAIAMQHRSCL